jgi:hypothetical protein
MKYSKNILKAIFVLAIMLLAVISVTAQSTHDYTKTLKLENGDSYDFETTEIGRFSGGNLYLKMSPQGKYQFWSNNNGQRGVMDLGYISNDLEDIDIARYTNTQGYEIQGVTVIEGNTYAVLPKITSDMPTLFRVLEVGSDFVKIEYLKSEREETQKPTLTTEEIDSLLPNPELPTTCGDSYGGNGFYAACSGDLIKHESGTSFRVKEFSPNHLTLGIEGTSDNEVTFTSPKQVVVFDYSGKRYKVEFNNYNTATDMVTLYIGYGGVVETTGDVQVQQRTDVQTTPVLATEQTNSRACDGCKQGTNCLPYGTRLVQDESPIFCSVDGKLQKQLSLGETCQNNYECSSNQCINGTCVDLVGQLEENRSLMERILSLFRRIFA